MSEPDLLIVELLRDGGEVKKQLVGHARLYGKAGPTAGEHAALAVMAMVAEAGTLRPGDRINIRIPIEGEDIPGDEDDEEGGRR